MVFWTVCNNSPFLSENVSMDFKLIFNTHNPCCHEALECGLLNEAGVLKDMSRKREPKNICVLTYIQSWAEFKPAISAFAHRVPVIERLLRSASLKQPLCLYRYIKNGIFNLVTEVHLNLVIHLCCVITWELSLCRWEVRLAFPLRKLVNLRKPIKLSHYIITTFAVIMDFETFCMKR
jgi:hypothetical protein